MNSVRRLYLFLVCAVSLNAVTWATISLARNIIAPLGFTPTEAIAFQIAVIIAGLPIFIVHWLWGQRLAVAEPAERTSTLRYLYLFGMLAVFVVPFLVNAASLIEMLLKLIFGRSPLDAGALIAHNLIAMLVLVLLWAYHMRVIRSAESPLHGERATVRRIYVLAFSAVGIALVTLAVNGLLRWVLYQFGNADVIAFPIDQLFDELTNLIIGLPLWLIFWQSAQRLFNDDNPEERDSALRKFYLYALVFVGVVTVVSNVTLLLTGILQQLLSLTPDGDWRNHFPAIVATGILWAYHATVLQADEADHAEAERQAHVRRAYLYLVATIGLLSFVGGVGGNISVLIRSLADLIFNDSLREQVAWFTAALIAGLPVWLIPWRQAQLAATALDGEGERRATTRKAYLYFFLFLATLAVLSGVIYILWRLLSLLLGETPDENLAVDLAQAIAFALLGVGVWLYHGSALRVDGALTVRDQARRLEQLGVVVVDMDGFGRNLYTALQQELPTGKFTLLTLPSEDTTVLDGAGLIIGGHTMLNSAEIANTPARKLLAPLQGDGWEWAGVERRSEEETIEETVRAVRQIVVGDTIQMNPARQIGTIIAAMIAGIIVLIFMVALLASTLF